MDNGDIGYSFDSDRLRTAIASDDPERFAKVLTEEVDKLVAKRLGTFREQAITPIEQNTAIMTEVAAMDSMYPGWREDANSVIKEKNLDPSLSLRSAYERHISKKQAVELGKLRTKQKLTVGDKKKLLSADGKGASPAPTTPVTKKFASTRDAILDAMEKVSTQKGGK